MRYISAKKIAYIEPDDKVLYGFQIAPKGELAILVDSRNMAITAERNTPVVRSFRTSG
jgi:hypothetical protein